MEAEKVTATKRFTDSIDAIYNSLGAEAALPEIRRLANMKIRSRIHRFDQFQREELIQDCLVIARSGKFKGVNKHQKPVRYSTWISRVIDYKINNAIRARISKAKQEAIHRNPFNLALLDGKDRALAYLIDELREQGATFKEIAQKVNASGILGKDINHVALRKRFSRLLTKAEVLPPPNRGRVVTPGTETAIPYSA